VWEKKAMFIEASKRAIVVRNDPMKTCPFRIKISDVKNRTAVTVIMQALKKLIFVANIAMLNITKREKQIMSPLIKFEIRFWVW